MCTHCCQSEHHWGRGCGSVVEHLYCMPKGPGLGKILAATCSSGLFFCPTAFRDFSQPTQLFLQLIFHHCCFSIPSQCCVLLYFIIRARSEIVSPSCCPCDLLVKFEPGNMSCGSPQCDVSTLLICGIISEQCAQWDSNQWLESTMLNLDRSMSDSL